MSYEEVLDAKQRVEGSVLKTPVFTSDTVDELVGRKVFFKCENLQKTGAFKARGALNAVLKLKEEEPEKAKLGVVSHSSGNHALALAWASSKASIPCTVVVPRGTPQAKCDAIRGYGGEVVFCEPNPVSRQETCSAIAQEKGMTYISSCDNYDVIAGQGTIGLELLEEVPDIDAILVPVSGGGMISGIAIAAKQLRPDCKVFAVEANGKELEASLKAEQRLWPNPPQYLDTIAEGIRLQQCGHKNFPIMCKLCEKTVFTVPDKDMVSSMKFAMTRMKLVIEASSAAGLSAVMSDKMNAMDPSIQKVGVILCGGNVDVESLPWYD